MSFSFSRAAVAAVFLATPFAAAAQQAPEQKPPAAEKAWSFQIGAGAGFRPDYEGSDDYEVTPVPHVMVSYRDLVFLRGPMLGANVLNVRGAQDGDRLRVGPLVRYQMGRDEDANDALKGLGDIDGGVEVGAFVSYSTGPWSAGVTAFQDVSGSHDGLSMEFSGGYKHAFAPNLTLRTKLSTTWADDDYTAAYFGVSSSQSQRSGLRAYQAEGGIKDVGVGADLDYSFNQSWGITGSLGYKRLVGDAADSPLVKDEGTANQFSTGLVLKFRY